MGRLKIKKKEAVIPFRETLAYRFLLLTISIGGFLIALYVFIGALRDGLTVQLVGSAAVGVAAAFGTFYNLDHLRDARIPQRTLKKMKRR
jgi:hypothetical protein